MRLSVILPVYNAAAYIQESVRMLDEYLGKYIPDSEIIVVDDASSDGSYERLAGLDVARLRLFKIERNTGKFAALKKGMREAQGACRVFTDADLPYQLSLLADMERLVNGRGVHIVVGDRSLEGSLYRGQVPIYRRCVSFAVRNFLRIIFVSGFYDSQCGLKAFRADVAEALFPMLRESRFAGDLELLYLALKCNVEVKRIPVQIQRVAPSSVQLFSDGLLMLRRVALLMPMWRLGFYRSQELAKIVARSYSGLE